MSATKRERRFPLTLKIFVATALVVVVVLGGTLALVSARATRTADEALRSRLENTSAVAGQVVAAENEKLAAGARAATQNPNFIAAFNKGGPGAIVDLANSFQEILGADYVLITDAQAQLRGRTDDPSASGTRYDPPAVVHALEGHQAKWYVDQAEQRLFLAVATPLKDLGSGVVLCAVVATHQVTDSLAAAVKRASGSEVVFYLLPDSDAKPVVVASTVPRTAELVQVVAAAASGLAHGDADAALADAKLEGQHLVGLVHRLENEGSSRVLGGYLALRSRDQEMAAFRRTQRTIVFAGLAGLAVALAGSWLVGGIIGRPVRSLVELTHRVAAGDYEARVDVGTRDEIGELAGAFQRMVEELQAKQQLVEVMRATSGEVTRPINVAMAGDASTSAVQRARGERKLELGSKFAGRYEIKDLLGIGGMGMVYRAWDAELGETVAIKTLRMDAVQSEPAALERFKQEIRLARRITHRNVVRTHDLGEVDGLYFITMEYVEGHSLKHLIQKRGSLPVNVTLTVGKQLCRALEVAHEQGVIHRDIKPQNLIVAPSGTLKVMDFGIARLAKQTEGMTQVGMAVGTPEYMAPEQLLGADVDFRADLYATGAVLFESLTGRPPFVADSQISLVAKTLEEAPPPPSSLNAEVPAPLEALILRALSKDPTERPQSALLLFEELDAIAV